MNVAILRNKIIVENADMVIAIHDGKSRGTQHTIDIAREAKKPVTIITLTNMQEHREIIHGMKKLNIEDQDRLDNVCGDCGNDLGEVNRSGWFAFFGDGQIQIELCIDCNKARTAK